MPHVDLAPSGQRGRYLGLLALTIALLFASIALPSLAHASGFRFGFDINERDGEATGSLFLFGYTSTVGGTVERDVYAASIRTTINGTVNGSVHALGGTVRINGAVHGSVHLLGGNSHVSGVVDGDIIAAGGTITIEEHANVRGDVFVMGGSVRIDGTVGGHVYANALSTSIHGEVRGSVDAQSARLSIGGDAMISGAVRYQSPTSASVSSNATVTGGVHRPAATPWSTDGSGALQPFGPMARLVMSLLTGAVVIAVAPRLMYRAAWHAEPVLLPAAIGFLALIIGPAIFVVLAATLLGIPLALISALGLVVAAYLSQVVVGMALGRFVLPGSWRDGSRGYALLIMTIGVIVLGAIRMVPIPFLGTVITVLITFWGLGAFMLVFLDLTSRQTRRSLAGRRAG